MSHETHRPPNDKLAAWATRPLDCRGVLIDAKVFAAMAEELLERRRARRDQGLDLRQVPFDRPLHITRVYSPELGSTVTYVDGEIFELGPIREGDRIGPALVLQVGQQLPVGPVAKIEQEGFTFIVPCWLLQACLNQMEKADASPSPQ